MIRSLGRRCTKSQGSSEIDGANSKRTIAFFIDHLYPAGAQHHMVSLVRSLNPAKYRPLVYVLGSPSPSGDNLEVPEVPVTFLRLGRLYEPRTVFWLLAAAKMLRRERVQLVQTYLFCADVFGPIAASLAHVPVVVGSRRNMGYDLTPRRRWLLRLVDRLVDRVVCPSAAVREQTAEVEGIARHKLVTIYNGVDLNTFNQNKDRTLLKRRLGLSPDHKVIGAVGNLRAIKGHEELLRAAFIVAQREPSARFLLVGDGDLRPQLVSLANELGVNEIVQFLGMRQGVPQLLQAMDCFVLPSRSEGLPNALLEAMAAGLPVVATNVGGIPEVIDEGKTGILVPPSDHEALACAIISLLSNPTLRHQMGRRARETVEEKFSLEKMVRSYETLYDSLSGFKENICDVHASTSVPH